MSVARLKACIEAMRGDTITNAQVLRIGTNLYPLTSDNPDASLTNDQKCAIILDYLRRHTRALTRAGAELLTRQGQAQADIDAIKATADAAAGDV